MLNEERDGKRTRRTVLVMVIAMMMVLATMVVLAPSAEAVESSSPGPPPAGELIWYDPIIPFPNPYIFLVTISDQPVLVRSTTMSVYMIVLVNASLYSEPDIAANLDRYAEDVELTGIGVSIYTSTTDDPVVVRDFLASKTGLIGTFMIGDIPSAWFEMDCWDPVKHEEFPCDYFYTDLDGAWGDTVWPGNGIYDTHTAGSGDLDTEIWLGRLVADQGGRDESDLVNNYLDKVHAYREGDITFPENGLVYVDDDWIPSNDEFNQVNAIMDGTTTHVHSAAVTNKADYMSQLDTARSIVHVKCHGSSGSHTFKVPDGGGGLMWEGTSVVASDAFAKDSRTMLYNLFVCSGARYTSANNIGSAYILADTYGLAAVGSTKTGSMTDSHDFYDAVGDGFRLGTSLNAWMDTHAEANRCWRYGMTLLGDPTLRVTGKYQVTIDTPGLDSANDVITYVENGVPKQGDISGGTWAGFCDHGTHVNIQPTITGSTYRTQDDHSFWVVEPMFLEVEYYQQHYVQLSADLPPPGATTVHYVQFGDAKTTAMDTTRPFNEWCDDGSALSVDNPVMISSDERYSTQDTTSFTVNANITEVLSYYHQYRCVLGVYTIGAEVLSSPNDVQVETRSFGADHAYYIDDASPETLWLDGSSVYSFAPISTGSTSTHRWATSIVQSYTVLGPATTIVPYHEQFLVTVTSLGGLLDATYHGDVTYTQFGSAMSGIYYDGTDWADWCDQGTFVQADEIVLGPTDVRYHTTCPTNISAIAPYHLMLFYHEEVKVTIEAFGLQPPAETHVCIEWANPSPSDDVSGGDTHYYTMTLNASNGYSWTNWVHKCTQLTADPNVPGDSSNSINILIGWTVDGVHDPPPSVDACEPGATYVAHYIRFTKTMDTDSVGLGDDVIVTLELETYGQTGWADSIVLVDKLPQEFSYVMRSMQEDGVTLCPAVGEDGYRQTVSIPISEGDHTITFVMRANHAYATTTTTTNNAIAQISFTGSSGTRSYYVYEDVAIQPYCGRAFSKTVEHVDQVSLFEGDSWQYTFIVYNTNDYDMLKVRMADEIPPQLRLARPSVIMDRSTDMGVRSDWYGNLNLRWSIPKVMQSEAFRLELTVYMESNPMDPMGYDVPSYSELNSPATLTWYDPMSYMHRMTSAPAWNPFPWFWW